MLPVFPGYTQFHHNNFPFKAEQFKVTPFLVRLGYAQNREEVIYFADFSRIKTIRFANKSAMQWVYRQKKTHLIL